MARFQWDQSLDPSTIAIPADVVAAVPAELAREENVMPVVRVGGVLTLAVDRPADFELIDRLRFVLGNCNLQVQTVAAPTGAIRAAVARYYRGSSSDHGRSEGGRSSRATRAAGARARPRVA